MSKGLNQTKETERAAVARRRIALNGRQPGLGTLAAMDWLGKPKEETGRGKRS